MDDSRQPIIVGAGQVCERDQAWPDLRGPLDLMTDAVEGALADTGARLLDHVDDLSVVNVFSWDYGDLPLLLAQRLGLTDFARRHYLPVGGNTPQRRVNEVAAALARGDIGVALLAGAEAGAAKRAARKAGHLVDWGRHTPALAPPSDDGSDNHFELEQTHGLPIVTYPLWEPALRVAAGRTPAEQSSFIGRLMSRFTEVAASNPYAWFPTVRTPEELMTERPDNRMISTPYTKLVNSIMRVDQGAALVLTTVGKARELGIHPDRWVYVLGGGDCYDIWNLTERVAYDRSPAMRKVAEQTWKSSGLGLDDVAHFDFYSCFPSAVQLALEAWGLSADDARPPTVTGGLPYAGGPGNNYVTGSIATMVRRLRDHPGDVGLCTGLGMHVTKHSAGLYSSGPPAKTYERLDPAPDRAAVEAEPHPRIDAEPEGTATIEGYSVLYGREGPETARCLARLDEDRRTLVSTDAPDTVAALLEGEWHGREIEVTPDATFRV